MSGFGWDFVDAQSTVQGYRVPLAAAAAVGYIMDLQHDLHCTFNLV